MSNRSMEITSMKLIETLKGVGLNELAAEVENAHTVMIRDERHFTVLDEYGYGNEYIVDLYLDCIEVYGRLVEPDGGTVWMFRNEPDYIIENWLIKKLN